MAKLDKSVQGVALIEARDRYRDRKKEKELEELIAQGAPRHFLWGAARPMTFEERVEQKLGRRRRALEGHVTKGTVQRFVRALIGGEEVAIGYRVGSQSAERELIRSWRWKTSERKFDMKNSGVTLDGVAYRDIRVFTCAEYADQVQEASAQPQTSAKRAVIEDFRNNYPPDRLTFKRGELKEITYEIHNRHRNFEFETVRKYIHPEFKKLKLLHTAKQDGKPD